MDDAIFVVDVMPFLYRGHFVFLKTPRRTSTGINTSALTVLATSITSILKDYNPSHIVLALDSKTPTFRHELDSRYKAQRQKMPEDIAAAIPMALEFAEALKIPILRVDGFEADDLLGTFAARAKEAGVPCFLVTPDKDAAQLVDANTKLIRPGQSRGGEDVAVYDEAKVCEHWGLSSPEQMIDYLAMVGDASDNIPGIPGVGEKTAALLLKEWGSLDAVLEHASEIKGKLSEKIAAGRESALLSRTLAAIRKDVPLPVTFDDLKRGVPDQDALRTVLQKYELTQIAKRLLTDDLPLFSEATVSQFQTIKDSAHTYICVETNEQLDDLFHELDGADLFAFDTETAGLDTRHDRMVGMSFATAPGKAWYVPVPEDETLCREFLAKFDPFFGNPFKIKVGHNIKFDLSVLARYGFTLAGELHDTMLENYVLNAAERHGMDALARLHLNYDPIPIEALIGEKKKGSVQRSMADLTPAEICEYAAEDADVTLRLEQKLRPVVRKENLERALLESEEPLIPILVDMEREGVRIDIAALREYGRELERELMGLELKIRDLVGGGFNISSPKQLGEILFDHLKLDPKAVRTPSGQYATDEATLWELRDKHPIVNLLLDHRACSKLKNTYVDKLPECIDPATGRIHTTFSQALTETGRLSSFNPNLQNIPIRTERGQRIRSAFTARDENHVLVAADYSQIELRVMAAASGDENMKRAFLDGADIHTETAARVYNIPPAEVTSEMRSYCKMVNFGIIYGISAFGLGQRLGIPLRDAKELIDNYFLLYPGVKLYMTKSIEDARAKGYAETLLGRRRMLPDITSRNVSTRTSAERNAINTPIQGTAADVVKLAMVRVYEDLRRSGLKTKMILQIHDELLFDVPKEELEVVRELVRKAMTGAADLGVPLDVDIGCGDSWLEAH